MGIAGAAAATVIARAVEMVWAYLDSLPAGRVKFRPRYLVRLSPWLCRDFWKYVTPVLGNEVVWGVGFTMGSVILGHMGSDAVAANSIASIAKNLLICLCTGIGSGGAILVGNELGAGSLDRAKQYGEGVAKLSIVAGAATGAVLLCLSPLILRLTNLTPAAEGYLKWMLVICSYYCIGKSVNSTVIGAGSVVTRDIPANSVAAGNPCKVIREINEQDMKFYYRDRPIDPADLEEERRLREEK